MAESREDTLEDEYRIHPIAGRKFQSPEKIPSTKFGGTF
jgi:hypothetical protein